MIDQNRRTVLKSISLLAILPMASLSALTVDKIDLQRYVKRVFTLTNLTPNTLTLDESMPINIPAHADSSKLKLDLRNAKGATIAPGANITFDVFIAKENMPDIKIDHVEIKSKQDDFNNIVSVMDFNAQISVI